MRINILTLLLLLLGITTMYHLLPKMKPAPIPHIHPRGFHQTWNINRSRPLLNAVKHKPIPSMVNRARRCADNCILREYMDIML